MNKIVVIAPPLVDDFVSLLSFVRSMMTELEAEDSTIIYFEKNSNVANFLTKGIRLVHREEKDLGLLESVRFAHKLDEVFNITHLFNLDTSIGSISLARSMKANHCLGMKGPVTNLLYEFEFMEPLPIPMGEAILERELTRASFFHEGESAVTENFFKEKRSEPFFFVALNDFTADSFLVLEQLLVSLGRTKVIFWSPSNNEHKDEVFRRHPHITDASEVEEKLIYKYINASFGVLTDRPDIARVSNYFLKENFYFTEKVALKPDPLMVNKTVSVLNHERNQFVLDYSNGESESKDNANAVVDIILSLLKI